MTGRLLHAETAGYILVANNVDVWSDVHPDLASAQEEQAEIVTPTVVYGLVGLELFETSHRERGDVDELVEAIERVRELHSPVRLRGAAVEVCRHCGLLEFGGEYDEALWPCATTKALDGTT